MVDALERCGYPRCNGGVMAVNDAWRHDVSGWRAAFGDWIDRPSEYHLMESSIAFDLRSVAGDLQVRQLMAPVIATVAGRGIFLGRLARDATGHRPPLGFFGRFAVERSGDHKGSFDVKAGVMLPITDIARLHALARGSTDIATDDRLAGAAAAGPLSHELAAALRARYDRRQAEVIATAARLFAERGYAAVGMDDIGAAAGVTGPLNALPRTVKSNWASTTWPSTERTRYFTV